MRVNWTSIRSFYYNHRPKVKPAVGMIVFGSGSVFIAREVTLAARNCAIEGAVLSKGILKHIGQDAANKVLLGIKLSLTPCSPQIYYFAGMGIAAAATCSLAYRYAREVFRRIPEPPPSPSPHNKTM